MIARGSVGRQVATKFPSTPPPPSAFLFDFQVFLLTFFKVTLPNYWRPRMQKFFIPNLTHYFVFNLFQFEVQLWRICSETPDSKKWTKVLHCTFQSAYKRCKIIANTRKNGKTLGCEAKQHSTLQATKVQWADEPVNGKKSQWKMRRSNYHVEWWPS
jgi:hypothetical protein